MTNVIGSSVTREVDDALYLKAGPEIGVAASKTIASQVTTLALLAVQVGLARDGLTRSSAGPVLDAFDALPGAVQRVLDREATVHELAERFVE